MRESKESTKSRDEARNEPAQTLCISRARRINLDFWASGGRVEVSAPPYVLFFVVIFRCSLDLGLFLSAGVGLRTEFDRLALLKKLVLVGMK